MRKALIPLILVAHAMDIAGAADRVADYQTALERAKTGNLDVVVFQRGSDWNRLGEFLLEQVWMKEDLVKALPDGLLLVVVDQPESLGRPPVAGRAMTEARPLYALAESPQRRLRSVSEDEARIPSNTIQEIVTSNGTVFTARSDGVHVSSGPNPHHEMIRFKIHSPQPGRLIRLDFPLDESLPGRGPGRASNGNFAISEIDVTDEAGNPVTLVAAWASGHEHAWGAWQAIDGIRDKGDNLWNAYGHQRKRRTLLLRLDQPRDRVVLQLTCHANWGQHVPGTLSGSILSDSSIEQDVQHMADAELQQARNSRFTWRGDDVPRIAYMDREGRPVTSEDAPRRTLTVTQLVSRIRAMKAMREKRDQFWTNAESASGPRKAELLLAGLDQIGAAGTEGHERCYKPIVEAMRAADSNDVSGVLRRMKFGPDPREMPDLFGASNKKLGEKDYEGALALIDAELRDPRNRVLNKDHLQRMHMAKYNLYRQWPGQEEKRIDVLREIARIDPETYHGLGAIGYLAMFHKDPTPSALCYGWATNHVQSGPNVWTFHLGTTNYFDHAGRYLLRIIHNGGKDTLDITRVALVAAGTTVSGSDELRALAPGGRIEIPLTLPSSPAPSPLVIRIESRAVQGRTDVAGRFEVDPLL